MAKPVSKLEMLYDLLGGVDETYNELPLNIRLQVEEISRSLPETGPRKLLRRGPGSEFRDSRPFQPGVDDPRRINAKLSARAGRDVVVEYEAEIRQHFYLWRDASRTMGYASPGAPYTKKQASEIMLLAFAKHLARNEELVGILDGRGMYRGGKVMNSLASQLTDVTILTGDMPTVGRRLPRNSTVVLFSDFMMEREEVVEGMDRLTGAGLRGYMVMVLDPQEIDFLFRGHIEFEGLEGEGRKDFKKAESMRTAYQQALREHIAWLEEACHDKGFRFILQRTDEPLHEALMGIYGLSAKTTEQVFRPNPKPGGPK